MHDLAVLDDAQAVAHHAAAWLLGRLGVDTQEALAVCLSGGTTPRILFETLARPPYLESMPWHRIHWFWCDERFVPSSDPRSNYGTTQKLLFARTPVPRENIHPISTTHATPEAAAAAHEEELKRFYGAGTLAAGRPLFDAAFLGVGADGHTASLFPGSPVLQERGKWVAAVQGLQSEARITLTYPVLESSREIAFLVSGAGKRAVMEKIFLGDADAPATRLRPAGRLQWFVDRAAAPVAARAAK